ncbi:flagellar biosynthesis protein FlhB [Periweissella beninensis]|uniref:Flagellar biosynthetic protein FlhB n=1 Tax=Periweissella beninensis TaxID=504936 RepID=A0ABT0VKG7_9LACO|nr:flagellar biosynthesis protein FlhB [Periweissella beninensis]MBM7544707.1 flagellar biosynthetic protein FlhB [Periweissella beninensis]MCM2436945.1 flagellar biosynthesis protein FlhB [Periweissella beninensis]MCT4396332.1 flagellar biosynthesis protein FlhB [Periweissella beninensis]
MADKSGKTEAPTPKRLRDARKRGEVTKSQELNIAISLLAFGFLFLPSWEFVIAKMAPYMVAMLEHLGKGTQLQSDLAKILLQAIGMFFLVGAPFMVIAIAMGFVSNLIQVGLLFTFQPIKPKFSKLNPLAGFKQMFGGRSLMNLFKTLLKLIIVAYLCYRKIITVLPTIINLSTVGTAKILLFVLQFARSVTIEIAVVLLIIGLIDYLYQRYTFRKNLRMSKEEVKEEFKQMEGDPKIKAQRRAKYQAMVRNAVANVQKSTVVITNPTHYALAIRYDSDEDEVPKLLAKGMDNLAQKMKAEAQKYDIPMIENRPLAHALYDRVEPGEYIPTDLYEAVAEIIALVYQLDIQKADKI